MVSHNSWLSNKTFTIIRSTSLLAKDSEHSFAEKETLAFKRRAILKQMEVY